jgi:hypothetical protein
LKFSINRFNIARRVNATIDVDDIAIAKDADDLADCIALSDVGKKLISKAGAFGSAFYDASDINERDCGRNDFFGVEDLGKDIKTSIGDANNADVGLNSGEWVIRGQDIVLCQGVKEGRFSDIR